MRKSLTLVAFIIALAAVSGASSTIVSGKFHFSTFSVPGSVTLSVDHITDTGAIAGYFSNSSGAVEGYLRSANGILTTLVDPDDDSGQTFGYGNNNAGTAVGYFLDTATGNDEGFLYRNGAYTNYIVTGQTGESQTAILGVNDLGDFCGVYLAAPSFTEWTGFLSHNGTVTSYFVSASMNMNAYSINDLGVVAGDYQDSGSVYHGFVRAANGDISTIDVPTAGMAANQGTLLFGINNLGWISGHFIDGAGNVHGFLGVPTKQSWEYFQIDVPGASATYGGGLNDLGVVAGHYNTSSGAQLGYIATPALR